MRLGGSLMSGDLVSPFLFGGQPVEWSSYARGAAEPS